MPKLDVFNAIVEFVDFTSSGRGEGGEPVRLNGIGDLDGDGLEDVVFSLLENADFEPGSVYVVKGSTISELTSNEFDIDNLAAAEGVEIGVVPFLFTSLSTQLSLAPDIDGDGLPDYYLTSNQRLAVDPPGVAILLKSSDVSAALTAEEGEVDIERLFFNETPVP